MWPSAFSFEKGITSKKIGSTSCALDDAWKLQMLCCFFREVHELIVDNAGDSIVRAKLPHQFRQTFWETSLICIWH
jgi:hypothetical protein